MGHRTYCLWMHLFFPTQLKSLAKSKILLNILSIKIDTTKFQGALWCGNTENKSQQVWNKGWMLEMLLLPQITAQTKVKKNYAYSVLHFAEEIGTGVYCYFPGKLYFCTFPRDKNSRLYCCVKISHYFRWSKHPPQFCKCFYLSSFRGANAIPSFIYGILEEKGNNNKIQYLINTA